MTPENFKAMIKRDFSDKKFTKEEAEQLPYFVDYWSEPLKSGRGILYDRLKSWHTGRRFGTWMKKTRSWNKKTTVIKAPIWKPEKQLSEEERKRGRDKIAELKKKFFNK